MQSAILLPSRSPHEPAGSRRRARSDGDMRVPPDIAARHGPSREPITSPTRRSSGHSRQRRCRHVQSENTASSIQEQGACACRIGSKAYVSPASGLAGSDRFGFKCRRECDAAFACLLELDRYAYSGRILPSLRPKPPPKHHLRQRQLHLFSRPRRRSGHTSPFRLRFRNP